MTKVAPVAIRMRSPMRDQSYKNATVYFWSGTGNSYRVATWTGEIASDHGLKAGVFPIDKSNSVEQMTVGKDYLFGFVFPTHGFTAPWHVLKFIRRLPHGNTADAFCIATRAGLKFGPIFIPGISGSGTFIVAMLLMLKGYTVRGMMSVDMPSNWYSFHPIQRRKRHEAIIGRGQHKVAGFIEKILSKKLSGLPPIIFTRCYGVCLFF